MDKELQEIKRQIRQIVTLSDDIESIISRLYIFIQKLIDHFNYTNIETIGKIISMWEDRKNNYSEISRTAGDIVYANISAKITELDRCIDDLKKILKLLKED